MEAAQAGRSFYFFDFDDNVAFLATPVFLSHLETGFELAISSSEYALAAHSIGRPGPYADYRIDPCDETGTFRRFRDRDLTEVASHLAKVSGGRQAFVEDLAEALGVPGFRWKGPSWSCFVHAALNQRPTAVITARGHRPDTIKAGIDLFVARRHLPATPNYLAVYPVSDRETRASLGDVGSVMTIPELKKAAIRASVRRAVELYGGRARHRFGMSDDDPRNIELITEEMGSLKQEYPDMSFFVIETKGGQFLKWEVGLRQVEASRLIPGARA